MVCESGDEFAVKIGVSSNPRKRYAELRVAIPYKSVMLHALVGTKKKAYGLEGKLHFFFDGRNTRGEWFFFSLEDKEEFHIPMRAYFKEFTGRNLVWEKIMSEDLERKLLPLNYTPSNWMRRCVKN